jgi:hypothetical protein
MTAMNTLFEMRSEEEIRREELHRNDQAILDVLCGKGPWPLNNNERRLLELMRTRQGRQKVMTIGELGEQLRATPREVKNIVRTLVVAFHLPIVASRDAETGGYYFATTLQERIEGSAPYVQEALALLERVKVIRGAASMKALLGQLALDLKEESQ